MENKIWNSVPPKGKTRYFSDHKFVKHGRTFKVTVKRLKGSEMSLYELFLGVVVQTISHCNDYDIDFDELVEKAQSLPTRELLDEDGEPNGTS